MKRLLLLAAVIPLISATVAQAQPRKGDWMVGANIAGGTAYLNSSVPHQANFNINPNAGYFLSNRLAVGVSLGLGMAFFTGKNYAFNYAASPFTRYYFVSKNGVNEDKLYLFAELSTGINGYTYVDKAANIKTSAYAINAGIGPGLGYMITPNVGIEGLLKVNKRLDTPPGGSQQGSITPTLGIGFQIYLPGRKKPAETE